MNRANRMRPLLRLRRLAEPYTQQYFVQIYPIAGADLQSVPRHERPEIKKYWMLLLKNKLFEIGGTDCKSAPAGERPEIKKYWML